MSLLEKSPIEKDGAIERPALPRRAAPDALARALASPFLGAALAVAALAQQLAGHLDCDVSWFLTFAEKFVDGATAYVDVTDPNPPAAFLTLVPAVVLARALTIAPETAVLALVFLFTAGSIAFSFSLLRNGAARSRRAWMLLLNAAIFLLLLAPAIVFAEREHLALLALLPLLAALAAEERRSRAPRAARRLAGLGGGLAVALKPHFALAIALPALAIAWRERSLRALWRDELVVAALAAALYALLVALFFPDYVARALPLALEIYAPARDDLAHLLTHSLAPAYGALLAGFLVAAHGVVLGRATLVALAASIGFFATFLIQGKGWINHAYPAIALMLLAFTLLALRDRTARTGPPAAATPALIKFLFLPAFVAAPACFGLIDLLSDREEHPGLLEAATTGAPPHPRVATIASQLDFGHPLVRELDGEWVGRQNALWVTALVGRLLPSAGPERRARLEAFRHADLEALAEDLREGRPDIVVVEDEATRKFVAGRPETAGALESYRLAERAGEIEIWRRSE
jgi:hypothetical protein